MTIRTLPALCPAVLLALLLGAAPAAAVMGDWVAGQHARVRLVAAGVDASGNLSAGVEVELDPGWHTYWRSPGDAGMAPVADFAGSTNVDEPTVAFPAPARLDDGFAVTNIYKEYVLLPVTAKADSPSNPIDLSLKLDLGVCAEICVPEQFEARLTVPPTETDAEASRLIETARALVPGPSEPGVFAIEGVAMAGGTEKRPVFEIKARVPEAASATVFVEGPLDWYAAPVELVGESGGAATYHVEFDRLTAKTPISGASLRVTIVSGTRAIEQNIALD